MDSSTTIQRPYPELTWVAVIVGWIIGVVIAVSIGYAALILGFSIEGSELAAILGFGILRGLLRRKSIIENNIVQTIASGVNGASSGMMFSVPAIFLLGYGDRFDPVILTFGCIAGAFLGIAFIIPLRKHMIDYERLTYPGGVAVATILKSPGAGPAKAVVLLIGIGYAKPVPADPRKFNTPWGTLLVAAAGLTLLDYPLQITTAMTFSLCLGLAVDDTGDVNALRQQRLKRSETQVVHLEIDLPGIRPCQGRTLSRGQRQSGVPPPGPVDPCRTLKNFVLPA